MSITLFGSCRLDKISNHNNLNNSLNFTSCTKDVIQLIKFLKGEIQFNYPYNVLCFRSVICFNAQINNDEYKQLFSNSNLFIIEICSMKKYMHNNYYLNYLGVDPSNPKINILRNMHTVEIQTAEEIENDILYILELLKNKKVIFVSHYNAKLNGNIIEKRNTLIQILKNICDKHHLTLINPTEVLEKYEQADVMTGDLAHYTEFGLQKFGEYIDQFIKENV